MPQLLQMRADMSERLPQDQIKYRITGSNITPIAWDFLIFMKDADIPIGIDMKNIISPKNPVNKRLMIARKSRTPIQTYEYSSLARSL